MKKEKKEKRTRIYSEGPGNHRMASHFRIRAEKTGHYFTHGTLASTTKFIWICLHGYGQLARYFIQKFEFLDPSIHYVICPDGLNRFYAEGVNDRPASSWMTREDRLDEIADFILFLEALRTKLHWDKNPDIKLIYFGFSQGVTTLIRWLSDSRPRVDYLLLWAGGIPDDILYQNNRAYYQKMQAHYFIGDKDPYINSQRRDGLKLLLQEIGIMPKVHEYEGDHRVDENVLAKWLEDQL